MGFAIIKTRKPVRQIVKWIRQDQEAVTPERRDYLLSNLFGGDGKTITAAFGGGDLPTYDEFAQAIDEIGRIAEASQRKFFATNRYLTEYKQQYLDSTPEERVEMIFSLIIDSQIDVSTTGKVIHLLREQGFATDVLSEASGVAAATLENLSGGVARRPQRKTAIAIAKTAFQLLRDLMFEESI